MDLIFGQIFCFFLKKRYTVYSLYSLFIMVETPINTSIDKIDESIQSANTVLSNFQKNIIDDNLDKLQVWNTLSSILGKINKTLQVNLFGLGTVSSLLGVKMFDIDKYKKKWGIWNMIFKKYGGIEWLHKTYIEKSLSNFFVDQPEKKSTITTLYTAYQKNQQQYICTDFLYDSDSLNTLCDLWFDEKTPKTLIDKLPQIKFSYLSKTIFDGIVTRKQDLDPNVLAECGCIVPKTVWPLWSEIIDITNPSWQPQNIDQSLIDKYLVIKIKQLSSDEWFTKHIQSPDHFVLSLMGWLFVSGNVFPEAILLWVHKLEDFSSMTPKSPIDTTEQASLSSKVSTKKQYMSYIKNIITTWESRGNYGAVNPFDVNWVSLWLLQWHGTRAKDLLIKMNTSDPTEFATIMGTEFTNLSDTTLWTQKRNDAKITKFKLLMQNQKFKKVMDDFMDVDIQKYIVNGIHHGITDPAMLVYYSYMQNAWGSWAKNILNTLPSKDLTSLHNKLITSSYALQYPTIKKMYESLYTDLIQTDFSLLTKENLITV